MMAVLLLLAAYLLGSFSPAWLAGRIAGKDLRQLGSKNLGATNAGRVLGWHWFAIVFLADVAKGVVPVLLGDWLASCEAGLAWLPIAAGFAAVLGHIFTCFHGFRGGKAVATSLGVLIALLPAVAGYAFGTFLVVWLFGWLVLRLGRSGAVGLASMVSAVALVPLHLALTAAPWSSAVLPRTLIVLALAVLVLLRHRSNLRKLLQSRSLPAAKP
jgi:glycerol-3-phosphate acyltransferase PlsY